MFSTKFCGGVTEWATVAEALGSMARFFAIIKVLLTASGHSFILSDEESLEVNNAKPLS
ncbi:MAG: hypothetical protein M3539_09585 [Acidobacteriota bacterium]|nr:hypothetical protein [Acidobacteriota bacterium]